VLPESPFAAHRQLLALIDERGGMYEDVAPVVPMREVTHDEPRKASL